MAKKEQPVRERAAIDELIAITGPELAYEMILAGLYHYLEDPRSAEAIDTEGERN